MRGKTLHLLKLLSEQSIPYYFIVYYEGGAGEAVCSVRVSEDIPSMCGGEHLSWSKAIGQVFRMALLRHGDETRKGSVRGRRRAKV